MPTFAEQLSAMRKEHHITQEQLAQELNISRTTISRWESGKVLPDIESIKRLSQILNYNFFSVTGVSAEQSAAKMEIPVPVGVGSGEKSGRINRHVRTLAIGCLCLLVLCVILLVCLIQKPSAEPLKDREHVAAPYAVQNPTVTPNEAADSAQSLAEDPAPTASPSGTATADIVITPSDEVAYLDIIAVEDGTPVYGWHVDFLFENRSDIPFAIEKIVGYYYENDTLHAVIPVRYKDLRPHMKHDKLLNTDGPFEWSYSSDQRYMTHMICTIYGTDDNGNKIEVSTTVQYSQTSADAAEGP